MRLAFTGSQRKNGTTADMVIISAMMAASGTRNITMLENHISINNIGSMIMSLEKQNWLYEKETYCSRYGIDHLLRSLCVKCVNRETVIDSSVNLLYDRLYYFPQSYISNRDIFNFQFNEQQHELYRLLENYSDMVITDTEPDSNMSSMDILEKSDLIVACISQDMDDICTYIINHSHMLEKTFFVIGKYERKKAADLATVCSIFHIPAGSIGVIPFNMDFAGALRTGRALNYMNCNMRLASGTENSYFMSELKRTAGLLMKKADSVTEGDHSSAGITLSRAAGA